MAVNTAKVVQSGDHQIVELPPEIHLSADLVEVRRAGESVLLVPMLGPWLGLVESLDRFSGDFMDSASEQPPQVRQAYGHWSTPALL